MTDSQLGAQFALTVMVLLCVYYVIASFFCFFAYREFKGMHFDAGLGGGFGMGHYFQEGQDGQGGGRQGSEDRGNSGA